ncbi:hypothetical protein [Pusillimonas sp.]|uniref:hypothetical protein n=1 Tax=Pusillimonas sp. TaxID=3040095 RepID=UPI0029B165E7|nr:hypothetical protein [Pusillimonas sp.]MDX3896243.1 hypothetical protein [Pusillimonas sp.]
MNIPFYFCPAEKQVHNIAFCGQTAERRARKGLEMNGGKSRRLTYEGMAQQEVYTPVPGKRANEARGCVTALP